jgi:hypothetical protein
LGRWKAKPPGLLSPFAGIINANASEFLYLLGGDILSTILNPETFSLGGIHPIQISIDL